jgi:protein-tyrosine phosphatase
MVDASPITPQLYVGSAPVPDLRGFDVIVLCAQEYQPGAEMFPGTTVEHFPFDDRPCLSKQELAMPVRAARRVAGHMMVGRRVLVTCQMGRNRSAFVAALALHLTTGESGKACADRVRKHRVDPIGVRALSNRGFYSALSKIPGR